MIFVMLNVDRSYIRLIRGDGDGEMGEVDGERERERERERMNE